MESNKSNYNLIFNNMETAIMIIGIATGVYEIASRVVPTSKTWSLVGNVLSILSFVSTKLDKKK